MNSLNQKLNRFAFWFNIAFLFPLDLFLSILNQIYHNNTMAIIMALLCIYSLVCAYWCSKSLKENVK